jgi:hypothetical protein
MIIGKHFAHVLTILVCLCRLPTLVDCFIDLFLSANETSTLLGFSNTFFYIFNGELRSQSVSYRLDIPDFKNSIEFNWKINGPDYLYINYDFSLVDSIGNSTNGSQYAKLSINPTGFMPSKLSG